MSHPKTLCKAPWTNFQLDVNGAVRPCCKFEQPNKESKYQFPSLKDHDIGEIWKSDTFIRLREDFLNGEKPVECRACWEEEKANVPSYRQSMDTRIDLPDDFDYTDLKPATPLALDLKLSNVCNLKCRICGPEASSLWLKEYMEDKKLDNRSNAYLYQNRHYFLQNKITKQVDNRKELMEWLPNVQLIELTGGEPLLSTENLELLNICSEMGFAEHINLLIVTNGTIFKPKLNDVMKGFRKVIINFSIDDMGKRFEYERHPANWDKSNMVVANYLTDTADNFEFNCHTTVSAYNVYYLPEFIEWFIEKSKIKKWCLIFNILYYSREMSIQVLPDEVKKHVEEKLRACVDALPLEHEDIAHSLEDVITYMNGSELSEPKMLWGKFLANNYNRDEFRGQYYESTFPEFLEVLKKYNKFDIRLHKIKENTLKVVHMPPKELITNLGQLIKYGPSKAFNATRYSLIRGVNSVKHGPSYLLDKFRHSIIRVCKAVKYGLVKIYHYLKYGSIKYYYIIEYRLWKLFYKPVKNLFKKEDGGADRTNEQ